jgi:hypothetical protein
MLLAMPEAMRRIQGQPPKLALPWGDTAEQVMSTHMQIVLIC